MQQAYVKYVKCKNHLIARDCVRGLADRHFKKVSNMTKNNARRKNLEDDKVNNIFTGFTWNWGANSELVLFTFWGTS